MNMIRARVGVQQRILPEYRAEFFDTLATACLQGLSVFAGKPRPSEAVESARSLGVAHFSRARNLHFLRGKAYFYWQLGMLVWLQRWQPGLLIIETNIRNLSNVLAVRWMHSLGRPVIGWGLGATPTGGLAAAFYHRYLRSLDAVIAYSNAGARQYISAGIDPARVFVAANAVTRRPTEPPVDRPAVFRDGRAELLFIGRLQARKRIDTLLHALAALPAEVQPNLVVIGDGPERARLEALAWQIYPRARFTGARHGKELDPYFASADLFILPGTGGLAVQQAMAHSLPVIVGQADGTQGELVTPENGWVLPDDDPRTMTTVLEEALNDIRRLRRMGSASYRIVSEEVNLEAMVAAFTLAAETVL